jgi:hypothetical protein
MAIVARPEGSDLAGLPKFWIRRSSATAILWTRISDQLTNERLESLVEEMHAQKAAFHPEQKK